mmetsp:Transcript_30843/g.98498  ORF Transcript_30843/g.98498 Transcript_30843/m.98498 type:complete len:257 (-) Transcript_30843:311-1081(-)
MVIGTCDPKKTCVLLETTPAAPHKCDKAHGSKAFTLPPNLPGPQRPRTNRFPPPSYRLHPPHVPARRCRCRPVQRRVASPPLLVPRLPWHRSPSRLPLPCPMRALSGAHLGRGNIRLRQRQRAAHTRRHPARVRGSPGGTACEEGGPRGGHGVAQGHLHLRLLLWQGGAAAVVSQPPAHLPLHLRHRGRGLLVGGRSGRTPSRRSGSGGGRPRQLHRRGTAQALSVGLVARCADAVMVYRRGTQATKCSGRLQARG